MANTTLLEIFDLASTKFTDYDLPDLTPEQIKKLFINFLSYAKTHFTTCKKDLNDYNEILEEFNFEFSFREKEILAIYMSIAWLNTFILHEDILKENFGTRDFNLFSSANKLKEMRETKNNLIEEARKLENYYYWEE